MAGRISVKINSRFTMDNVVTATILLCIGSVGGQPRVVSQECLGTTTTCFSLYSNPANTWYQAYEHCINTDQQLVVISSEAVQRVVQGLTDPQLQGSGNVWISGARSLRDEWTDITGRVFTGVNIFSTSPDAMCGAYNYDGDVVRAVPCDVGNGELKLTACQTTPVNGVCDQLWRSISGVCVNMPVNWTSTWLQSQENCAISGGTLVHTGIDTSQFRQVLSDTLNPKYSSPFPEFWVGVHRNPWVWVTGPEQNSDKYMTYYHWAQDQGAGLQSHCMYTNLSDPERHWADSPCGDDYSYFICQNASYPIPTDTPTTQKPAESKSKSGLSQANIIAIAVVCAGVAVIVIVVVIIVIVLRKRRTKKNQETAPQKRYENSQQRPQYPADTYHSYMQRVQTNHTGDREMQPIEHDPYQSAESVRQTKSKTQKKQNEKEPQYNDVFMVDE